MRVKDWVLLGTVGLVVLIGAVVVAPLVPAWWRGRGLGLKFMEVVGMRMRMPRRSVVRVVELAVKAKEHDLDVDHSKLETLTLMGGDVAACVDAMIEVRRRGMTTDWISVVACDMAERDVMAIVTAGLDPGKVIGAAEFGDRFRKQGRAP